MTLEYNSEAGCKYRYEIIFGYIKHMNNFIIKITGKIGIDKITHFFAGATIALSLTYSHR